MDGKSKITIKSAPGRQAQRNAQRRSAKSKANKQIIAGINRLGVSQSLSPIPGRGVINNPGLTKVRQVVKAARSTTNPVVVDLVRAICLPHESTPVRHGGIDNTEPTAIARLPTTYNLKWDPTFVPPAGYPLGDLPASDEQVFIFRDPIRSVVYADQNRPQQDYAYEITGLTQSIQGAQAGDESTMEIRTPPLIATSVYQPHGPLMYPGNLSGKMAFWVQEDLVTFSGVKDTPTNVIVVSATDTKGNVLTFEITAANPTWAIQCNFEGYPRDYYTFSLSEAGSDTFLNLMEIKSQLIAQVQSISPTVWCHRSASGIDAGLANIGAVRVSAAGLLWSNAAAEIALSGEIFGRQVPEGKDWTDLVTFSGNSAIPLIAVSDNYKPLLLKTGMNTFLLPSGTDDFAMHTAVKSKNSIVYEAMFDLDRKHPIIAVVAQTTVAGGGNSFLTITDHIEFTTDSPLFSTERPRITTAMRDAADIILYDVPQFTENPLHIAEIWSAIKRGAKSALDFGIRHGPSIASGITKVLPIAASLMAML